MLTIADLRYAIRLLIKSPGFTLITIVVLCGGLGISLYTYAALNTLVYGELPVPEAERIVTVGSLDGAEVLSLDAWEVAQLRSQASALTELGGYRNSRTIIGGAASGRNVRATESDWRVFEFARTQPLIGRGFVQDDSLPGAEAVVVLGHRIWETEFAADPDVLGTLVRLSDRTVRVIGVMPPEFGFPMNSGIWLPLDQTLTDPPAYTDVPLRTYARLSPGVSSGAAETESSAILQRLRAARSSADNPGRARVSIASFQESSFGVFGAVVFGVLNLLASSILLLAAVNVGNLLLARMNRRVRETGIRVALGAPRLRLIMQSVLENFLICAIGSVAAVALAARGLDATNAFMLNLLGEDMPFWWRWRLDAEVLGIAGITLLATVVVVSVFPAISVGRTDPNVVLRDGAHGGGVSTGRLSRALVVVQIALISAFMVVGATAAIIAQRVADFDFGIPVDDLLTLSIQLPGEDYASEQSQLAFQERMLDEIRALPEVAAAMVMRQSDVMRFAPSSAEYRGPEDYPRAWRIIVSDTSDDIGPGLIDGRGFDSRDDAAGDLTAIVSQSLARTHWPNESAIGRTIEIATGGEQTQRRTIVGVVSDVAYDPVGITPSGDSAVYLPMAQAVSARTTLIARHRGDAARTSIAIYEALARIDPAVSPGRVQSYRDALDQLTLFGRTIMKLFVGCAAFAVLLAITGIYGMSSNGVILRSREIGLRRALGASNRSVIGLFIARGSRQLTAGLICSALLSAAALALVSRGFALDGRSLAVIAAAVVSVVSMTVLLSIYLSVRGVLRREPAAVLRLA